MEQSKEKIKNKSMIGRYGPYSLLLLFLGITFFSSYFLHLLNRSKDVLAFNEINDEIVSRVKEGLTHYSDMIQNSAVFFLASEYVTKQEFKEYTSNINTEDRFPGLDFLGYIRYIKADDLDSFKVKLKTEYGENFELEPPSSDQSHLALVKYIEPLSKEARELIGLNTLAHSSQKNILIDAAQNGNVVILDEPHVGLSKKIKNSFHVYAPVYRKASIGSNESEQLRSLEGFMFGAFDGNSLFDSILERNKRLLKSAQVYISIKSSTSDQERALYHSTKPTFSSFQPSIAKTTTLNFANQKFIIKANSTPYLESKFSYKTEYISSLLGVLLSFFIFFTSRKFAHDKAQIEHSKEELNKTLDIKTLMVEESKLLGQVHETKELLKELANFFSKNIAQSSLVFLSLNPGEKIVTLSGWPVDNYENLATPEKRIIDSIYTKVIDTREPARTQNKETETTFIGLPLCIKEEISGALILKAPSALYDLSTQDLEELIYIASICLENTNLLKELGDSNRFKDEFLATVSHELRTPLNVIYGHAQLLLEESLPKDIIDQVDAIHRSAKRQSKIIEDILDISSIIKGRVKFDPEPVNVKDALERALESVKMLATDKKIFIDTRCPGDIYVLGVETRLVQVFWKLLTNGIKFTPSNGRIDVSCTSDDKFCYLSFKDTGEGISKDFLPHVFEKFRQEDQTTIRSKGGLGLGLALVCNLIRLHGGQVKVESEGKGKGTTFEVKLPITTAGAHKTNGHKTQLECESIKGKLILVVDDEPESLDLVKKVLIHEGAEAMVACSAKEALRILSETSISLLISDIAMPNMNGYELIEKIRKMQSMTNLPAIALSAYAKDTDAKKALDAGFDSFLSKPFEKDELLATIQTTLQRVI